jgi:hypothetical protein
MWQSIWRTHYLLRWTVALVSLISFERNSLACKCIGNLQVCERFAQSDAVFVGRAESVEPDIDFWSRFSITERFRQQISDLQQRLSENENDNSPDTVRKLKGLYLQILPEQYKPRILGAANLSELEAVFEAVMENGKRIRLKVQVVYKGPSGDTRYAETNLHGEFAFDGVEPGEYTLSVLDKD